MAVSVTNRRGKKVTLLNPSEKARKFLVELNYDVALTNDGEQKTKRNGKLKTLSDTQKAFRAGYLAHQKDCNRAFKHKHPNYRRKTA